jgi:phosphoglycerate dehydrogenase-like enzyme
MTDNFRFKVALTGDFYDDQGLLRYRDIGLNMLDASKGIAVSRFPTHQPEIEPDQLQDIHGVIVLSPRITARSLSLNPDLLAVGRFGVGYDSVDVAACTAANVALYITAGAVDHSVAEATVGWMLALARHMRTKDLYWLRWHRSSRLKNVGRVSHEYASGIRSIRRRVCD